MVSPNYSKYLRYLSKYNFNSFHLPDVVAAAAESVASSKFVVELDSTHVVGVIVACDAFPKQGMTSFVDHLEAAKKNY